jgi:hypothetical protein
MKPLKLPSDDKDLDLFNDRLRVAEHENNIKVEGEEEKEEYIPTASEIEATCADLRHKRIMKLAEVMGYNEALAWQRDGISDYELNWEITQALRVPPESRYESLKKRFLWHESCWFMRRFTTVPPLTKYDGQGCNENGCILTCRFFEPTGRIEDDELIQLEEQEFNKEQELIQANYRLLGFNDDDSDEIKKEKWEKIRQLKNRIHEEQRQYLQARQHGWQSEEELKEIENNAWAAFYLSRQQ